MSQKGPETRAKAKEKQIDYEKAFPVFQTREELETRCKLIPLIVLIIFISGVNLFEEQDN